MKKYIIIIFMAVMTLFSMTANAQSVIRCEQDSPESCDPGNDGAAIVRIPSSLSSYTSTEWTTPTGGHLTGNYITGLKAGAYSVAVKATACNKVIYQDVVIIERDEECSIHASISATTNTAQCGETPTATLTASASGGTPPYRYSWGSNVKTVSGSGTYGVTVTDANGYVGSAKVRIDLKKEECSQDPNELDGPLGYGDDHYVSIADRMHYTILFENDPDFATAPASRVRVTYPIPSQQSIASVRLADFGFGSFVFNVPNNTTSYTKRLDVSDSLGVWVDVTAGIDMANNQIFWIFQSVDPATGFEPASSQMGFLLVNDSLHHGEGYVSFSVLPKNNLASGDTVSVDATIVFDDNTAINTNAWKNTFDAVPPTSHLSAQTLATDSLVCNFTFTAADDPQGSGVDNVELMVSLNDAVYTTVGYYAPTDTAHYTLVDGNVYRVLSRYFGIDTPINTTEGKHLFAELATELLPHDHCDDYNQAIMDFGATLCTPVAPQCLQCPLHDSCEALASGRVSTLPVKQRTLVVKTRHLAYVYIRCQGQTAIHQRQPGDIWQGLWEPVNVSDDEALARRLGGRLLRQGVKHVLTHRILMADFYLLETDERPTLPDDYLWIDEDRLDDYAIPRLIERLLEWRDEH